MAKQDLFRSKFKNHYLIINLTLSLDRKSLEQMTLPVYTVYMALSIRKHVLYITPHTDSISHQHIASNIK